MTFFVLAAPGWATAASETLAGATPLVDPALDTGTGLVDTVTGATDPITGPVIDTVTGATDPITGPVIDTVTPVIDTVTDATDPITDPVIDTVTPVIDDVKDAVTPVIDTVTDTTDPITDTVIDDVTDTTDPITDTATGATGPLTETVRDRARPVTDPVRDRMRPITDRVEDALPPVGGVVDDGGWLPGPGTSADGSDGSSQGDVGGASNRRPTGRAADSGLREDPFGIPADAPAPLRDATTRATSLTPAPVLAGARDSAAVERLVRGIAEASRQFSFPLTVAALVLLFLAVQGRLDARDPKLATRLEDEELVFV